MGALSAQDLRRMQRLVQEVWAERGTKSAHHIGDLAWQRFQHIVHEDGWRKQLWEDGGDVVAYGWLLEDGVLDFCIHPRRPELLDEVLDWADARETSALDADADAAAAFERHGYRRAADDEPFFVHLARDLGDVPAVDEPEGTTLRTVGEDDVEERVAAHRSAFHPSRVMVASYRNVMRAWPYRGDLDCVAVTADGRVAAYCLAWLDEENRVGELEPSARMPTSAAAASRGRSLRSRCAACKRPAPSSRWSTHAVTPHTRLPSSCTSRSASARTPGRSPSGVT